MFPLFEAQVERLALFRPESRLPKLEPKEVLPFEEGAPEPKVRRRRTYVTLERVLRFGKTLGCRGCEHIAEGVKHTDACHERFQKLLEDERLAKEVKSKALPRAPSSVMLALPLSCRILTRGILVPRSLL